MEIYKQRGVNDRLVAIIGWNHDDVILAVYGTDYRFAMNWDTFLQHYEEIEPFDLDVSDYDGPDLTIE